jgi:hypothetical protein
VRITCASGTVIHLRLSGNAQKLPVYIQTDSVERAKDLENYI